MKVPVAYQPKSVKRIKTRTVRPVQYMTIKFTSESIRAVVHGKIIVMVIVGDKTLSHLGTFSPASYESVYLQSCEKLAEFLEYRRVPDLWVESRPALIEVMKRCKVKATADDSTVFDPDD